MRLPPPDAAPATAVAPASSPVAAPAGREAAPPVPADASRAAVRFAARAAARDAAIAEASARPGGVVAGAAPFAVRVAGVPDTAEAAWPTGAWMPAGGAA